MTFHRAIFSRCRTAHFCGALLLALLPLIIGWSPVGSVASVALAGNPPVFVSPSEARGIVNQSFNYQIVLANFAQATYFAEGLPDGLTLDPKFGAISGELRAVNVYLVRLTASNADGTTTSNLTLTVEPADPPAFEGSAAVVTVTLNQPFSYQLAASNQPTAYRAEGLPDGLTLNPQTGLISGTPTVVGSFALTLTATNARGTGNGTLPLSVVPGIPVVTLVVDEPTANPMRGEQGQITLTREGGDLRQPLTVVLKLKGSAHNGVDFQTISLTKKFKARKAVSRIQIVPLLPAGDLTGVTRTLKIKLQASDAYTVGSTGGKVRIHFDP